jgi:hypothetical protein
MVRTAFALFYQAYREVSADVASSSGIRLGCIVVCRWGHGTLIFEKNSLYRAVRDEYQKTVVIYPISFPEDADEQDIEKIVFDSSWKEAAFGNYEAAERSILNIKKTDALLQRLARAGLSIEDYLPSK